MYETTPAAPSPAIRRIRRYRPSNSAFNTLAHTVLSNNARTLEDLVKEMLRPMLKSWLFGRGGLAGAALLLADLELAWLVRGDRVAVG